MKPRISQIIWTDWPALALTVAIPISFIIFLILPFMGISRTGSDEFSIKIVGVITALCISLLWWRIRRILLLFTMGTSAEGQVKSISITRDRGVVTYTYEVNGSAVSSWIPVHRTEKVLSLQEGQTVTVLFNPEKPKDSTIIELYR
jgi:hypothetical protein